MKEKLVFGLCMSILMVFGMETYNQLVMHPNVDYSIFLTVLKEAPYMIVIVFILSTLIGNPYGTRFMKKHCDVHKDPNFFCQLIRQFGLVSVMCPIMSFVAAFIFQFILGQGSLYELPYQWLETLIRNFPMAFFWSIFAAAPLTRQIVSRFHFSRS